MRWEDETYVKLYIRDTLTWRSWSWQARTVLMHLFRKVDHAGMLECGGFDPSDAVALMVDLPVDVVRPGLSDLARTGTVHISPGVVIISNFVEAQEARKTEAQKKRDQRARARDKAKLGATAGDKGPDICPPMSPDVPGCPPMSPDVPLQNASTSTSTSTSTSEEMAQKIAPPSKPPPPAHEPNLRDRADDEFRKARGAEYAWTFADERAIGELLQKANGSEPEILRRWAIALRRQRYPTCTSVLDLSRNWNAYAAEEPTPAAASPPRRGEVPKAKDPPGTILNPFRKAVSNG